MAAFIRQPASGWDSIPGTRWFRADLHIHTVDDAPGGRAKRPSGLDGDLKEPKVLQAYARAFLQAAVAAGIGVLGVTPHAVRCGEAPDSSAVWQIVETWNNENDDDGVPFRDKVFAVFPGFEPSFNEGKDGLHLQILFDPEVGRDAFLRAFEVVMGGIGPYDLGSSTLKISSKRADDALADLRSLAERSGFAGRYAVLAPHADRGKGLFAAIKSQVLELFEHEHLIAIELGDNTLPEEMRKAKGDWFEDGLKRYRYALYHSSDAYRLTGTGDADFAIGNRFTWMKLAAPSIEGLRQAFLAHDSRLRIAYVRDASKSFVLRPDPPSTEASGRPWIRRVSIRGAGSFFGGPSSAPATAEFEFSPDLTCIIGPSMAGKSTLLDGLRVHLRAKLPKDPELSKSVLSRAEVRFSAGRPDVAVEWQSSSNAELGTPLFFTQSELQTLASDSTALEEDVLAHLLPNGASRLRSLTNDIETLDGELGRLVPRLNSLSDATSRAEQEVKQAETAEQKLAVLRAAGFEQWQSSNRQVTKLERLLAQIGEEGRRFAPLLDATKSWALEAEGLEAAAESVAVVDKIRSLEKVTESARDELRGLWTFISEQLRVAREVSESHRKELEQAMAAAGTGQGGLTELRQLADRVKYLESYRAEHRKLAAEELGLLETFEAKLRQRKELREAYRNGMRDVAAEVRRLHDDRIELEIIPDARVDALDTFVRAFKQAGITGWWNSLGAASRPSPDALGTALESGTLADVGMSATVASRFAELMPRAQRHALRALPCRDGVRLSMMVSDGNRRPLNELSGGQRVALVLSLLLSSEDSRPLVIDQPEDDIDNRFLADTILPALRRLKGRRQVIVATHNANIVVNGDADQVMRLDATAEYGRIDVAGTIDEPLVRAAIVETVDGGSDAFTLRQRKYGY